MNLNSDFSRRAAAHVRDLPWNPSPMAGVDRRMLDRIGDEVARATTIVRFAPGSDFSPHTHGGGEEFIVLDGVFQDETGDYPAGSYIRNPPGSSHKPSSAPGCTIFVKLWQFDPEDRAFVTLDMASLPTRPDLARPGVQVTSLFSDASETVQREVWAPGAQIVVQPTGGAEILVLAGNFVEAGETFGLHDWLRLPDGMATTLTAGPDGAEVWTKTGHLADLRLPGAA